MRLPEFGVRRPVAALMIFIAAAVIGVASLTRLNLDLMPEIDVPAISVITIYRGAGPKEVEKRVSKPLETQLSTVTGLDKLESVSQESVSILTLRFAWGTDLAEAANDVRDKVSRARKTLPDAIDDPFVFKFDVSQMPIVMLGFSASGASRRRLKKLIEDRIVDPLKRVEGVAHIMVMGGARRQIRVEIDRRRMEATGVGLDQVMGLLAASNLSVPGGNLEVGRSNFMVRVPAEFKNVTEIGQLVVGANPRTGAPVRLNEVARVRDTAEEQTQFIKVNGQVGVGVIIAKKSGANTVEVSQRVRASLKRLRKSLPSDVEMVEIRDYSRTINRTIGNLKRTVMWGGILVILVILVFLRNLRSSLIVAVSIPTSVLVTFGLMFIMGYTLNMMSITSLAIAIGMVVDNSIVVLENIHRHREAGSRPKEGAAQGASEVSMAVIASTLTTVVIFVPVVFLGGIVGIFFNQLALIITMALVASLAVSLILVPMLSSKLLVVREPAGALGWLYHQSERAFDGLERAYAALLGWSLRHRVLVLTGVAAACGASLLAVPHLGTEYMPSYDTGMVQIAVELPVGTRKEVTGKTVQRMNQKFHRDVPETKATFAIWGAGREGQEFTSMLGLGQGSNYGVIMLALGSKNHRKRSSTEVGEALRPFLKSFPAAKVDIQSEDPLASVLLGGQKPITVEIRGHDENIAQSLAKEVAARLRKIPGLTDISISRRSGVPELQVAVDREKAATLGLNVASIAMTVRNAFNGVTVSKYRVGGDEYDIFVRLREQDRRYPSDIAGVTIKSMSGKPIQLGNVARLERGTGPVKIERVDQVRIIRVGANLHGRDLGSAAVDVKRMLGQIKVPPGFSVRLGGARKEQQKSFRMLIIATLLGFLLVYMVMAAQFESLRDPFIILFSIPFAIVGALWAFVVTGMTLSVLSFIGVIMLVGIVVNNGIVLVDYINILRARGMSVPEAVQQGGRHRMRPVLMTAVTTILGMLPLALSTGEGTELWSPMGTAVIGGLLVSTVITLIFVPTLYSVFERGREWRIVRRENAARRAAASRGKVSR